MAQFESKHKNQYNNAGSQTFKPTKSMTIAIFNNQTLIDTYTFRYSPQRYSIKHMGLYGVMPLGEGFNVDEGGYWGTMIDIAGNTGARIQVIADKTLDGESYLQSLEKILLDAFGARRDTDGNYLVGFGDVAVPKENLKVYWYNWIGPESYDLENKEFYQIFPNQGQIFEYNRQAGSMHFNFSLKFIGARIEEQDKITSIKEFIQNDPVNKALTWDNQFLNAWSYLTELDLDGVKPFSWIDALDQRLKNEYYETVATLSDIQDQIKLAQFEAQAYVNFPYLIYLAFNDFVIDALNNLGIIPGIYSEISTETENTRAREANTGENDEIGFLDWGQIDNARESFRNLSRLVAYPDRFIERPNEKEKKHILYTWSKNDTIRRVAKSFNVKWESIVDRNNLSYPYEVETGSRIIIPIESNKTDNTKTSNLFTDRTSSEQIYDRVFGIDISVDYISGEWEINVSDQDIFLTSGVGTIEQEITEMLQTVQGEFIDYENYGNPLLRYKGKKATPEDIAIQIIQLKTMFISCPGVEKINKVKVTFNGGINNVSTTLTLINGEKPISLTTRIAK